jgi:ABC-type cobalamin/Fe3+-siderophores transport system ATPase subunit
MPPGALDNDWSTLSGGEAQRVLVALAMAPRPQVLQLDESASALDLETKMRVELSVVCQFCKQHKTQHFRFDCFA